MLNMTQNLLSVLFSTERSIHIMETISNRTEIALNTWNFEASLNVLVGK